MKKANEAETLVAADEAQIRNLYTGEVLKEKNLCPLVLVRTYSAGVQVGYLADINPRDKYLILLDARRIYRWRGGCLTVYEVATKGPDEVTLSEKVPQVLIAEAFELVPVSSTAAKKVYP
jgi:hypothetical protein